MILPEHRHYLIRMHRLLTRLGTIIRDDDRMTALIVAAGMRASAPEWKRYAATVSVSNWGPSELPDFGELVTESKRLGFDRYPFGSLPGEKIDRDKGSEPDADRRQ